MFALRIEESLAHEIDLLAKTLHTNRSALIREAIIRFIEDHEDLKLAKRALKNMKSTKTLAQLRKELGLDS